MSLTPQSPFSLLFPSSLHPPQLSPGLRPFSLVSPSSPWLSPGLPSSLLSPAPPPVSPSHHPQLSPAEACGVSHRTGACADGGNGFCPLWEELFLGLCQSLVPLRPHSTAWQAAGDNPDPVLDTGTQRTAQGPCAHTSGTSCSPSDTLAPLPSEPSPFMNQFPHQRWSLVFFICSLNKCHVLLAWERRVISDILLPLASVFFMPWPLGNALWCWLLACRNAFNRFQTTSTSTYQTQPNHSNAGDVIGKLARRVIFHLQRVKHRQSNSKGARRG